MTKKILICVGIFWLIGVIGAIVFSADKPESPTVANKPVAAAKPTLGKIVSGCQVEWERQLSKSLKDPASLDWDHKSAELGFYKKKTPVVIVPYRAKNSFGALDLQQAICQINPETGDVVSVIK